MKKVILSYQDDLILLMSKIEEADLAAVDWSTITAPYLVVDDAPVFNKPLSCLRINTQTTPPSVTCPAELLEEYNRPRHVLLATTWKKTLLTALDWSQVSLTTLDRKIIMGVALSDEEKTTIYNEWKLAGSPGLVSEDPLPASG